MTKYREILRLFNHGINQTGIASSCGCARKTVRDVVNRAKAGNIIWPLPAETTDADLENYCFLINPCQNRTASFRTMITSIRKCCAVG